MRRYLLTAGHGERRQATERAIWRIPNGEFDDLADAGVWGLMRIRQGNLIRLASDETEEEWKPRAPREYYYGPRGLLARARSGTGVTTR